MSRREPDGGRAARMPSYLLVFMTVSSLCLAALAGSIALRNSGSSLSHLLAELWPNHPSKEHDHVASAAAKPRKPSLVDDPALKTDRQLLRAIAEQLENLDRKIDDTNVELRQIDARVDYIEDEKSEIDWVSSITAVVFLIQAVAGLMGILFQIRRRISIG